MAVTGCASLEITTSRGKQSIPLFPSTTLTVEVFNKCAPTGTAYTPGSVTGGSIKYNDRATIRFKPGLFDNNDRMVFSFEPSGGQYEYEVVQRQFRMRDFVNNKASWVIERQNGSVRSGRPIRCHSRVLEAT